MTKLYFSNESLSKDVIPGLESSISKLDSALKINENIYIPYEYINREFLNNYFETIKNVKKVFEDEKNFIVKTNKVLNDSMETFGNDLCKMKNVDIKFNDQAL